MNRAFLILVPVLLLAWGCGRGGTAPPPPAENPMVPLSASAQLYYDDRGGISESARRVVRDEEAWTEAWDEATSRRSDPPPRPDVDFQEHMVLVTAAGRMSPGDRIQVDSAGVRTERTTEEEEDIFEIVVRTIEGCGGIVADVFPITIVRLPRFEGRVGYIERTEHAEC